MAENNTERSLTPLWILAKPRTPPKRYPLNHHELVVRKTNVKRGSLPDAFQALGYKGEP